MSWKLTLQRTRSTDASPLLVLQPGSTLLNGDAVVENSSYWWLLEGTFDRPFEVMLRVNGATLNRDMTAPDTIWFRWDIDFNAGFADVALTGAGKAFSERVVIDPNQNKLVRKDFRLMLHDIIADTRFLASTSGMREGLSRGNRALPIAVLELMLEMSPKIQKHIKDLDKLHQRKLVRIRKQIPLSDARAVTSTDWNNSRRLGKPVDETVAARLPLSLRVLVNRSGGVLPERVIKAQIATDSRRREHEEVLGFLHDLVAEFRRSSRELAGSGTNEGEVVLGKRCRTEATRISRLLDLPIFNMLSPRHARWQHSHLYQRTEPYKSLYRIYRDLKSGISDVGGDFVDVPLRETFRLYETWVALRLARAASLIDPTLDGRGMFVDCLDSNRLTFSLEATQAEFSGNILRFKPVFKEVWLSADGTGSYSRRMIPDIILEVLDEQGQHRNLVVLDAKYRVDSQLNEAISSIHTYKDAIIKDDLLASKSPRRVVLAGFVVVPAPPVGVQAPVDWRQERMPFVLFREGYQKRFGIGAIVLTPGVAVSAIAASLRDIVRSNRRFHELDARA